MGLKARHPEYEERHPEWVQMQHTHAGERVVKEQTTVYLPATSGMIYDGLTEGQPGHAAYTSYITRAVFPNEVKHAVEGLVGIMHKREPKITVPKRMQPMLERITLSGESAATLMRRMNEAQLKMGRIGLLLEVPEGQGPDALPFVATYDATLITNWSTYRPDGKNAVYDMVVLNETAAEQQGDLSWQSVEKYRVLAIASQLRKRGLVTTGLPAGHDGYVIGIVRGSQDLAAATWTRASIAGKAQETIPFVSVNVQDFAPTPDIPPLLGLSNLSLAIYRAEADYRQALFMQGQETLVITGDEETDPESDADETRIGAGAVLRLARESTAEYIGVSADGLDAMRQALDADYKKAGEIGMRLVDTSEGGGQQSGDALRQRVAAKTASLVSMARAGGAALEHILKQAAVLMGEDPDKIKVEPNVDFANEPMTGKEMLDWMSAKRMGAPISEVTLHKILQLREVTDLSYEEEKELIDEEEPLPGADGGGVPGTGMQTQPPGKKTTPPRATQAPK